MSDIAQKILSQASLVRMPSLPELLLCELETFQHGNILENGQNTDLESLVAGDLFLYGRLLASSAMPIIPRLGWSNSMAMTTLKWWCGKRQRQ